MIPSSGARDGVVKEQLANGSGREAGLDWYQLQREAQDKRRGVLREEA